MKARMCSVYSTRTEDLGLKTDSCGRVVKPDSPVTRGEEMQQCFSKLKQIVPTVHVDQKLSKVQLLQHVIDYIMDLELTLQYQQQQQTPVTTVLPEHRKPLSENSYLNTMASHFESINLRDCDSTSRPVS